MVDLTHESKQRFLLLFETRVFQIVKYSGNEFLAPKQFRRNCGVILRSKWTVVSDRSEGRDQLPYTGTNGTITAHDLLRERAEMRGRLGAVREQMPNLRVFSSSRLRHPNEICCWAGFGIVFNIRQKDRLHFLCAP